MYFSMFLFKNINEWEWSILVFSEYFKNGCDQAVSYECKLSLLNETNEDYVNLFIIYGEYDEVISRICDTFAFL